MELRKIVLKNASAFSLKIP
uniref:Uncharacterized protein n=1 Tax=Lepeophtheirus salmonis TaxID=72036 RepID=A0A0K2TK25_LEPSM